MSQVLSTTCDRCSGDKTRARVEVQVDTSSGATVCLSSRLIFVLPSQSVKKALKTGLLRQQLLNSGTYLQWYIFLSFTVAVERARYATCVSRIACYL